MLPSEQPTTQERISAVEFLESAEVSTPISTGWREPWAARLAGSMGKHHALLIALSTLLLWLVVTVPAWRDARGLAVGKPAPQDILSPVTALLPDLEATAERRREVAALVPPVYEGNQRAQGQALSRLETLALRRADSDRGRRHLHWDAIEHAATALVRNVYRQAQIRSDVPSDIAAAHTHIAQSLAGAARRWRLNREETLLAAELARQATRFPNLVADEHATERARREAQNQTHAVFERVQSGDVLVQAGETITPEKWAQLEELNLVSPRPAWRDWSAPFWRHALAYLALCTLLILLSAGYLATLDRSMLRRPAALWLAAMTPILFLAIYRLVLRVPHADTILIPLAATAAILLTILLEARMGILCGLLIAAPGVLMARGDAGLFICAALAAWIGALSTANINSRRQVFHAGLLLTLANALLALIFGVLRESPVEQIISLMLWSGLSGIFAVVAGSGLAMVLERPFGITTHLHLLELLSPDEMVLRRMQTEAPGTYTHSLMVSLLAENAAKSVDADPLLSRVGGLYHDIGKLHRPHCFVENQSGENIHDRLSPQLSARVIVAHVTDGLALGRALKLPQPILDIIAQHHGTTRVEYFYRQAMQQSELHDARLAVRDVIEDEFRYPGPRPQTKEAAIVMLADTIEASARALSQPTPEKLEHHVATMIGQKLREGELNECDLTLRDLQKAQESFLHVLRGTLHQRIAYPAPLPEGGSQTEVEDLVEMTEELKPVKVAGRPAKKLRRGLRTPKPTHSMSRVQQALADSFIGKKTALSRSTGAQEKEMAELPATPASEQNGQIPHHQNGHAPSQVAEIDSSSPFNETTGTAPPRAEPPVNGKIEIAIDDGASTPLDLDAQLESLAIEPQPEYSVASAQSDS